MDLDSSGLAGDGPAGKGNGQALVGVSLFYLLYFAALGCTFPYLNLYYQRIGLTGLQIGLLTAIPPLAAPLVSVVWGLLSDSLRWRRSLLCVATGGTIVPLLLLSVSRSLALLVGLTAVYALFSGPVAPLADSAALEAVKAGKRSYGQVRLWGSLGYVFAAWALGLVIERTSLRSLFYGYAALMVLGFVVSLRLPARRRTWSGPGLPALRKLLGDRALLVFLGSVFFLSSAVAATENFFGLYLKGIGGGPGLVGLAASIAALSEVPVLAVSGALARRLSARGLYALGAVIWALRFLLYSVITSPRAVLAVQALHGASYASYFVGGVLYTSERAPEGLSATAQALFSGTAYGIGTVAGALAGGYLYDRVGMASLFRLCALSTGVALMAFLLPLSKWEARAEGQAPSVEQ